MRTNNFILKWKSYGCSFVVKLSWKKVCFFLKKYLCCLQTYIICRKKCFCMEKKFIIEKNFYWKKFSYREKYIWTCKKYISHLRDIFYKENVCVTNKCKSFLNTNSFCKKKFLIKIYLLKLRGELSNLVLKFRKHPICSIP